MKSYKIAVIYKYYIWWFIGFLGIGIFSFIVKLGNGYSWKRYLTKIPRSKWKSVDLDQCVSKCDSLVTSMLFWRSHPRSTGKKKKIEGVGIGPWNLHFEQIITANILWCLLCLRNCSKHYMLTHSSLQPCQV